MHKEKGLLFVGCSLLVEYEKHFGYLLTFHIEFWSFSIFCINQVGSVNKPT